MVTVLPENKALFDRIGITRWHDAGYTGSRGLSMTFERPAISPLMNGQVENLWTDVSPVVENPYDPIQGHAYFTAMIHLQVAPGRKIKSVLTHGYIHGDGQVTGFIQDEFIPWALKNKPDVGFRSLAGGFTPALDSVFKQITAFSTLCNAAGNYGVTAYADEITMESWLGIGAVNYSKGLFTPEEYTSESSHVDFSGIAPLYVQNTLGMVTSFNGTSTATPFIAGQMALVNDFFIDKIGRPLSMYEMYAFVQFYCQDVGVQGKDVKTGHGVFMMPDPKTINPYDWVETMTIEMNIGSKAYTVDGVQKQMDVAPFAQNNRTFVPIRFVAEALGCEVIWNEAEPTKVIIRK